MLTNSKKTRIGLALTAAISVLLACNSDPSDGGETQTALGGSASYGGDGGLANYIGIAGQYGIEPPSTSIGLGGTSSAGTTGAFTGGTTSTSLTVAAGGMTQIYDPLGTALEPAGHHSPGTNCMSSACHAAAQATRAFAFGGTVYLADGVTAAANVELAIVSGATTVLTYSAQNGNFWVPLATAPSLVWTNAEVFMRNATGETRKAVGTVANSGCNSCHGTAMRITMP